MTAPIVPASTILMLRDSHELEVLMVQRHHQIEFAAGALVFPGGKLAKEDADPAWRGLLDGAGEDAAATALQIAAIREAFEESGLLLARPASRRGVGEPLLHPDEAPALFSAAPGEAPAGAFHAAIRDAGLVLALDALTLFSNWQTPELPALPKRFDTYFFLAIAPPDQVAVCDGREAVNLCWIAPVKALADAAEGRRTIVFPTRMNLEMLGQSKSAAGAIADARARPRMKVEPEVVVQDGTRMLRIPPEAGYSVTLEPLWL
jgi:8-oxo-dGTP pyrophosphatase MutT (NUDIX family)